MSTETTEIVSKIDVKKSRKSNMHDGGIILPPTDIAPHKQTDSRAQTPELLQVGSAADPRSSHTTAKKSKRHKVEDTEKHAIASSQIPEDVEVTKPKKKKRKHVDVEESTSVREEEVNLTGTDKDRKKKKKKKKRDLAEENLDNLASTDERQISRKSKKGQTSEGDGIIEDREINITEKRNKKRNKEKRHDRQVDDVQSPKKKKANKIDLPNPDDDKSITDQARKGQFDLIVSFTSNVYRFSHMSYPSSPALAYAYAKFAEPDNWKFNKARQNWLIRNIWSEQVIGNLLQSYGCF